MGVSALPLSLCVGICDSSDSLLSISFSDEGAVEEQAQDTVKVTDTIVDMDDGIDAE